MRIILIITLVVGLFSMPLKAQQLPIDNQYHINPFSLSPALAGHNNNFELFMDYRNSWGGIDGAPEVSKLNLNGKLANNMGIGGSISNDKIGIFRNFSASLAYAYFLDFGANRKLSFGLSAGIYETFIDIESQNLNFNQDPIVQSNNNINDLLFDLSFGVNYQYTNWNIGLVAPQLFESKAKEEINNNPVYTLSKHYIAYLNYSYTLNRELILKPTAIIRTAANSPLLYEFGTMLRYRKFVWLSASYRKGGAVAISVGGLPLNKIAFNYSYEFSRSGMMSSSNGTHEVTIGILFGSTRNTTSSIFNLTSGSKKRPYLNWENE